MVVNKIKRGRCVRVYYIRTVLRVDRDPHETKLTNLDDLLHGELVLLVHLASEWSQL